jgi:hypothetical protein
MIAERRRKVASGDEDTYGMEKIQGGISGSC